MLSELSENVIELSDNMLSKLSELSKVIGQLSENVIELSDRSSGEGRTSLV